MALQEGMTPEEIAKAAAEEAFRLNEEKNADPLKDDPVLLALKSILTESAKDQGYPASAADDFAELLILQNVTGLTSFINANMFAALGGRQTDNLAMAYQAAIATNRDTKFNSILPEAGEAAGFYKSAQVDRTGVIPGGSIQHTGDRTWAAVLTGMQYLQKQIGWDLGLPEARSRSGGSGSGGVTADDIRNRFDIDQLAETVRTMWRTYLLDDPDNPTEIAKAYVETIVANPEQKVDFQTYVLSQIRKNGRYGFIYRNKPNGVDENTFLGQYINVAANTIGFGNAGFSQLVSNAAALGAAPESFQSRLNTTKQQQRSSGYLRGLEAKAFGIRGLLGAQ